MNKMRQVIPEILLFSGFFLANVVVVVVLLRGLLPETQEVQAASMRLAVALVGLAGTCAVFVRIWWPNVPFLRVAQRWTSAVIVCTALVVMLAQKESIRSASRQLATVRLHELLAEHVASQGSTATTDEQQLVAAKAYAGALDAAIQSLSDSENIVILSSNAVVSGTRDVTDAVRDEVARRLGD